VIRWLMLAKASLILDQTQAPAHVLAEAYSCEERLSLLIYSPFQLYITN
jgi:hypothetical protein